MRYSFRVKGNRRLRMAYGLIALLLIFTVVPLVFLPGIAGLIIAMLFGYFSYQMIRLLVNHLKSFISVHDEGVTLRFPSSSQELLTWNDISHAGIIHTDQDTLVRFIYAEDKDRLATIPEDYDNLEELDKELKAKVSWYDLEQKKGDTVQSLIKPLTKHAEENGDDAEDADQDSEESDAS